MLFLPNKRKKEKLCQILFNKHSNNMAFKNGANNIARRIAVVTGTNRGIGFEICKQLSEKGVVTIMTSRDEAKGKKAMNDLLNILAKSGVDAKDKLFFHPLDVVSNASIEKFKKYLVDNFNQLDILVNNAGIYVDKWDEESFKQTMETNVYGPIRFTDALLPLMKVHKGISLGETEANTAMQEKKFGRIVTLSSGLGNLSNVSKTYQELITKPDLTIPELFKVPFMANDSQKKQFYGAYCLSKAMVNAHARVLQKELNADGYNNIHVAAIDPGWVQTDMGGPNAPKLVHEGARGPVDFVTKDI